MDEVHIRMYIHIATRNIGIGVERKINENTKKYIKSNLMMLHMYKYCCTCEENICAYM